MHWWTGQTRSGAAHPRRPRDVAYQADLESSRKPLSAVIISRGLRSRESQRVRYAGEIAEANEVERIFGAATAGRLPADQNMDGRVRSVAHVVHVGDFRAQVVEITTEDCLAIDEYSQRPASRRPALG